MRLLLLVIACVDAEYVVDFSGARYLDATNGTRLFSWFFPNPGAPLVLWLNGGPGCSSLMGLLYEIGPFQIVNGVPVANNASWTQDFALLFVDSPVGTGLSYGPAIVTTEEQVAADLGVALAHFFALHPALLNEELFVATESYGGKYAPYIVEMMIARGWNIEGAAVGNGFVEPYVQVTAFALYAYATGFVDLAQAQAMGEAEVKVKTLIEQGKLIEASDAYDNVTLLALNSGGWFNPADIRVFGFPDFSQGENWINANYKQLGVPPSLPPFEMCNDTVGGWFAAREMLSVTQRYARLLEQHGVRFMFFNGNMDFTVPTTGVEMWLNQMQWSGQSAFLSANRTVWRYSATDPFAVAGLVKQTPQLTFVSVPNAGHSVCQSGNPRSREMMGFFVAQKPFPVGTSFPPEQRRKLRRR
jgi:vitellogenic carboxypeptidase-like protein